MAGSSYSKCVSVVKELIDLGLSKIASIHCSGDTIREILRENFL